MKYQIHPHGIDTLIAAARMLVALKPASDRRLEDLADASIIYLYRILKDDRRCRLVDLKTLSDMLCELDGLKNRGDAAAQKLVADGHRIIIETLGPDVIRVYGRDDEPEELAA